MHTYVISEFRRNVTGHSALCEVRFLEEIPSACGVFSLGEVSTAEISEVAKYVTNGSMDSFLSIHCI